MVSSSGAVLVCDSCAHQLSYYHGKHIYSLDDLGVNGWAPGDMSGGHSGRAGTLLYSIMHAWVRWGADGVVVKNLHGHGLDCSAAQKTVRLFDRLVLQ